MKQLSLLLLLTSLVSTIVFADDVKDDIEMLKEQVRTLSIKSAGQNLKLGVDFRSEVDQVEYKMADGTTKTVDGVLANRLWIDTAYKYNDKLSFVGKLSYYKLYGQDMAASSDDTNRYFDWVASSNPNSDSIRVREASIFYTSDGLFGWDKLPWIFSIGRRPSTGGMLGNFREGFDKDGSPLAHIINMEFDGFSMTFKMDKLIPVTGMDLKICGGRGTSNVTPRFSSSGTDYAEGAGTKPADMLGIIFTPYNDGQYRTKLNMFSGKNLIGYSAAAAPASGFHDFGGLTGGAASAEINGIGNSSNSFLKDTTLFGSYAWSKTDPNPGMAMLGSTSKKSGTSYWVGLQIPTYLLEGDRLGFEYNHGDKYWRSFTYGEDTLIGSKLAARGKAMEAYYNMPLIDKALTAQFRYTKIKYDFTGSNGFFDDYSGVPMTMNEVLANGMNATKEAQVIRAYLRYSY